MEVMDTSLDKFYKKIYNNGKTIPENVLGKIAYAVIMISLYMTIGSTNNKQIRA